MPSTLFEVLSDFGHLNSYFGFWESIFFPGGNAVFLGQGVIVVSTCIWLYAFKSDLLNFLIFIVGNKTLGRLETVIGYLRNDNEVSSTNQSLQMRLFPIFKWKTTTEIDSLNFGKLTLINKIFILRHKTFCRIFLEICLNRKINTVLIGWRQMKFLYYDN